MQQKQLTQKERYHIWASLKRGVTQKEIAETIGVHPSTICREIQRNKDSSTGEYHYAFAQTKAQRRQQNKAKYSVFAHAGPFGHPAVFYSDSLPVVNL